MQSGEHFCSELFYILYLYIPGLGRSMQEVFKALPYVVTIIVLVFTSFRKKKEHQPPAALGLPYFREDDKIKKFAVDSRVK